jgi:enediyne biosynthesis protein E4
MRRSSRRCNWMFVLWIWLVAPMAWGSMRLEDVTALTGIEFVHTDGAAGKYHISEPMSAGLALFDYDLDGDIDIYFLNGAGSEGQAKAGQARNALYRNDGAWRFMDVTSEAGVGDTQFGLGVTVGDYDNDGDPDLYLNNHGPNVLYRNNGNGSFTDATQAAGLADGSLMGAGANFLDIDGDGDLDLYVAHYVTCLRELEKPATRGGYPAYLGPAVDIFANTRDSLYRNNGDGSFTDITEAAGLGVLAGAGMGTTCGDVDQDGDTDILVANDMSGNFLLLNDGHGKFEDMGLFAGMAFDQHGEAQGSMAMELADYDNDGRPDLHLTSYQEQMAALYRNLGDGAFADVTTLTGAGRGTTPKTTWGNGLVDFDNDGDRDLFIACGHIQPHVDAYDTRTSYWQTNMLFENQGKGKFRDVSDSSGDGMKIKLASRGAGFDDLDNDGDVDVVILNSRSAPTLLRNDSVTSGHWLQIQLQGKKTNRDGVGALVRVYAGDTMLVDEVHSGRGYQSHYGSRLYFGLGPQSSVDRIEVAWIGGGTDVYPEVRVDQIIRLEEGKTEAFSLGR